MLDKRLNLRPTVSQSFARCDEAHRLERMNEDERTPGRRQPRQQSKRRSWSRVPTIIARTLGFSLLPTKRSARIWPILQNDTRFCGHYKEQCALAASIISPCPLVRGRRVGWICTAYGAPYLTATRRTTVFQFWPILMHDEDMFSFSVTSLTSVFVLRFSYMEICFQCLYVTIFYILEKI